ncbi:CDK5 regulatory subunit-associated protein 3-like [Anneissia japonica]|uniref:CDK5 regulatory subunit-associated protein 3-like n=1 Tax=Anneissia japonica TaxID=1529436 RepID=UPI00142570C7|nr:CDK5 regulatory subunit-associated protein 3-like [Anneissia japonica]
MPEVEEIKQLVVGTYINYFHCKRIVELLKVSESNTKNIFGRYSSQRMKDWLEVVSIYERDNIYLAESAHLLTQNVNYEIPAIRRSILKCKQLQAECDRKEKDYISQAASAKDDFQTSCKKLGIKGEKIKTELIKLVADLPQIYSKILSKAQKLHKVTEFYEAFVQFTVGSQDSGTDEQFPICPALGYILQHGNTTVYRWRTGKDPMSIEEVKLVVLEEEKDVQEDEIDWGDGEIDFGISLDEGGGGDAINFDIEVSEEAAINWGEDADTSGITLGSDTTTTDDGVARGVDALTLLDNLDTRNAFVNDILELEFFLRQRLKEMKGEADILSVNQFQGAPSICQMQTVDDVNSMLILVQDVLSHLRDSTVQHFLMIKSSPRYVDRLADSLKEKLVYQEKMIASQKAVVEKRQASLEEQRKLEPKLDTLIMKTRELKQQIEQEISKKYKNRPVNLMGAVNNVLS